MPFTINQIKNKLKPVRPNMFFVEIAQPAFLGILTRFEGENGTGNTFKKFIGGSTLLSDLPWYTNVGDSEQQRLKFRCEATEFPGRTLATTDDVSAGPAVTFAYDTIYNDISLTFIADEGMQDRGFFDLWMEWAVKNSGETNDGIYARGGQVSFYDDIVSEVRINQLNDKGDTIIGRCTLRNAFPIQLTSMPLSWEEQNTYQRFAVTFNYRYHHVDYTNVSYTS